MSTEGGAFAPAGVLRTAALLATAPTLLAVIAVNAVVDIPEPAFVGVYFATVLAIAFVLARVAPE